MDKDADTYVCVCEKKCVKKVKVSYVQLFATAQTIQSMEFSRPEYWSG